MGLVKKRLGAWDRPFYMYDDDVSSSDREWGINSMEIDQLGTLIGRSSKVAEASQAGAHSRFSPLYSITEGSISMIWSSSLLISPATFPLIIFVPVFSFLPRNSTVCLWCWVRAYQLSMDDLQLYTRSEYGVHFSSICLKQFEHEHMSWKKKNPPSFLVY